MSSLPGGLLGGWCVGGAVPAIRRKQRLESEPMGRFRKGASRRLCRLGSITGPVPLQLLPGAEKPRAQHPYNRIAVFSSSGLGEGKTMIGGLAAFFSSCALTMLPCGAGLFA